VGEVVAERIAGVAAPSAKASRSLEARKPLAESTLSPLRNRVRDE